MYYCNKCGQEMIDSGHRCAVRSERLTSVVRSNATTGWISVKDMFPENLKNVLIFSNTEGIQISWYRERTKDWTYLNVTHWMPLPKPPEV